MPDKYGRFKGISVPELPWRRGCSTEVHEQGEAERLTPMYYWSCSCGQSSKLHQQRRNAELSADLHAGK